jgi:hypothetical protein
MNNVLEVTLKNNVLNDSQVSCHRHRAHFIYHKTRQVFLSERKVELLIECRGNRHSLERSGENQDVCSQN